MQFIFIAVTIHVNADWNVITRTILPVIWNPDLSPLPSVPVGTGPTVFSAFLSPKIPTDGWLWGLGPVVQIPTISNASLGSSVWGGGPTAASSIRRGHGAWAASSTTSGRSAERMGRTAKRATTS